MQMLWLIPLAPLIAALLAGVLALTRRAEKAAPFLTILGTAVAGYAAIMANPGPADEVVQKIQATWLTIPPNFHISLGVTVDSMAWVMLLVVCLVSLLVQIYSIGYMKGENGYARYFSYLSLFTASMIGLVVASNLFQLYVCWELVGICSYLLIGFWWFKPSAANAAKKAFVVTRFGDVGFMLGVLFLVSAAGSFDFTAATQAVGNIQSGAQRDVPFVNADIFLWLVPILLFCGAIGKSAQFPLHVWLPDAMEGPTPVSALIHAATMVAAGVYMVARLFPIFQQSGIAMDTVLLIGTVTAFLAATIALVQVDIKKVMAYSTISQLGYMMLGLGAGGSVAGMFHLTTHAMFKALLFLAAGSVIHAMHHATDPNDLRQMGGLFRRMPSTAWTCLIGVLALAGLFPLSGFWSKDAILATATESHNPVAKFALVVAVVVAGITAFYSLRMWLMAFWGKPRSEAAEHAHESPPTMTLPLWVLAVPSLFLGFYLHQSGRFAHFLGSAHEDPVNLGLVGLTTVVALAGLALAWKLYAEPVLTADPVEKMPGHGVLAGLWGMDAFWDAVGARGSIAVGRTVAWLDRNVVDKYVVHTPAWLCAEGGARFRKMTNGQAQTYTAWVLAGILLLAGFLMWRETKAGPPQNVVSTPRRVATAGINHPLR
jgi:NADH-quinone oxidoreductase subunit L